MGLEQFQGARVREGRDLNAMVRGSKQDAVTHRITRVSSASSPLLSLFFYRQHLVLGST
jgi:hypothetical protein